VSVELERNEKPRNELKVAVEALDQVSRMKDHLQIGQEDRDTRNQTVWIVQVRRPPLAAAEEVSKRRAIETKDQ
jgi:hypothetical protein